MATPTIEEHLLDLLTRWDEAQREGRDLPPEELCAACPEFVEEVRRRIAVLRQVGAVLDDGSTGTYQSPGQAGPDGAVSSGIPSALSATSTYLPQRHHAQGGLGEVLEAHQVELDRLVALKRVRPDKSHDAARRRFLREAAITAALQHPGIVSIYGLGQDDDGPFYTMPFVRGRTLQEAIQEFHSNDQTIVGEGRRSLELRRLLQHFIAVCNAVAYAHDQGVVHRDLKPANIMLGPYGETLVMDWGLAKRIGPKGAGADADDASPSPSPGPSPEDITGLGGVVGTLLYMSPEQAAAQPTGPASDLYSLGVILYAILIGKPPYEADLDKSQLSKVIREAAVVPPRRRDPRLPRPLEAICLKALAARPDDRYPSVNDLAKDLERWLADEPVSAWREPILTWAWRWGHRHRRSVLAAVLVLLAILGGVAGTTWGLIRAERASAEAERDRQTAELKDKLAAQLTDYLVRTFQSADPVGLEAAGFKTAGERFEEQTLRRILDRGSEVVRESLHGQPLAQASLLDSLGNAYRNLGDWDRARDLLEEAHHLRREHLGEDAADTIVSLQALAHLARDRGDYGDAEWLYREVISRREKSQPSDPLLQAQTKAYLGWMTCYRPWSTEGPQFDKARLAEAEQILLDVLKVRESHLPEDHRDIGYTLAALASIKLGQPDQKLSAIGYARRALAVFRQSDQDESIGNAMAELIIADGHRQAGRFDQAEALYLKVLGPARRHLGGRHPLVVFQIGNLAGLYRQQGDLIKAEATIREFIELVRPIGAYRSQAFVVDAIVQYGDEVRQRRSAAEAEPLYREALLYARERPQGNEKNIATLEMRLAGR
jgi:tetratricopeptide (TPR) repeat protein/tRNA A-37 threonylcarbamoyl transferase component Bud32